MEVHAPQALEEALRLRAEHPGARPIAGGTDLMVALNAERERPAALIDLGHVTELRGWRYEGDELVLGAALTYTEAAAGEVASALPALAAASRTVGSPQIRNRGTIGGNLGTASPAGDSLPPLLGGFVAASVAPEAPVLAAGLTMLVAWAVFVAMYRTVQVPAAAVHGGA